MKTLTVECSNSRQSKEYSEADCSVGHGKAHWINPCPVQGYYNAKICQNRVSGSLEVAGYIDALNNFTSREGYSICTGFALSACSNLLGSLTE